MRVAIASDIHGNKQAFQAVIDAAEAEGAEELWCLGDLVGYGAEPDVYSVQGYDAAALLAVGMDAAKGDIKATEAMYKAMRTSARPPHVVRLPRIFPLSRFSGATPTSLPVATIHSASR